MKKHTPTRLLALCLALLLALSALAVAEDSLPLGQDPAPEAEAMPEEISAPNLLDGDELPSTTPAPDATSQPSIRNAIPAKLTLGVKEKYAIDTSALSGKITFKSTKAAVASVSAKGVITGKKAGTAKITVTPKKGKKVTITVTVKKAPSKVTLNKTAATLKAGGTLQLKATLPAKTASYKLTWASNKPKVAKVDESGRVTAVAAGTATITVKTFNGKKATCKVTVKKLFSLDKASVNLTVGQTATVVITYYGDEDSIWFNTDDDDIIDCEWSSTWSGDTAYLYITGVGAGSASIDIYDDNYHSTGICETISVKVTPYSYSAVTYRALLIGQENFSDDYCPRNRGDVSLMTNMLNSVKGLYGGSYAITRRYDQTRAQVLSAISSAFAGADDDDVSLFFIASHGVSNETGIYAGALAMCPEGLLTLTDLANALKAVPGKVIVFIESCGSGAAVYGNGDSLKNAAVAFDQAVVDAFAAADPGMEVEIRPGGMASDGLVKNTGEFRQENKFYVLTASRHLEDSWGSNNWNFFTKWLTEGIGTSRAMPADANGNGQTTLNELYQYISKEGDDYPFYSGGRYYYQHVQVYPANSGYVLFVR